MKRTLERILYLALLLLLSVVGCDEAEITQILDDITSDDYAGMVLIPAGDVELGAPVGDVHPALFERGILYPTQTVYVDDFYIDTHEVTIAEFQEFVDALGYENVSQYSWNWYEGSTPEHPVFVSYEAAQAYAEWAGKRLPTDFEWEKAARGGLVGKRYPWGGDEATRNHAHFTPHDEARPGKPYTVPVGSYEPNGYSLYDMAGNVAEWVHTEPHKINNSAVTRGGSWFLTESYTRVYMREILPIRGHYTSTGFRCAKDMAD